MRAHWLIAVVLLAAPAGAKSVKAGIDAWGRGDYARALAAWRPLAAKANPDAMFNLGQAYRLGRGVPIDLAQAQGWYERAAREGHVDAEIELGMLLFVAGNRANGLQWLKSAADKGEARAQLFYGTALFNGDGLARDLLAAYRYISRSAAQGLAPAKTALAQVEEVMLADVRRAALAGALSPLSQPIAECAPKPIAMTNPSPAAANAAPVSGNWRVQLGAFSHRVAAERLVHKNAEGPLIGRDWFLISVGRVTRLQAGPFASHAEAVDTCTALTGRGQPCFVVRTPH